MGVRWRSKGSAPFFGKKEQKTFLISLPLAYSHLKEYAAGQA